MKPSNVLVLPGWHGSAAPHWQARWVERHGYRLVEQHDWERPLRGDWLARLEDMVLDADEPAVLVAHGLGCILAAAWSATSRHRSRVKAALLVAPLDVERDEFRGRLPSWAPIVLETLAFTSVLVASADDPCCGFERARLLASAWGAQLVHQPASQHLNADSHLASWPEGHVLLQDLMKD
ncbi:RBBP9/YdeN family alpha/beta hydrolase [Ramlibacter sp.]|uniref:RBBP9/YdeN family alpha/beta hydrolase n=1 Tax=Ramlibacter sp. TaxID=1917967 RepID=UPI002C7ABA73|nr:alpha/beta hydrolase [Ramlibacter sp.]HWI83536.1 alpha/beta hydrolase [Ramlibacter sp.]